MLIYYLIGVTCVISSCASEQVNKSNTNDSSINTEEEDDYYPFEEWSDTLDWSLLKIFSEKYRNVLVSPISLKIVLAILYEGSGGATEREFQNVLQFAHLVQYNRETYSKIIESLKPTERKEYILNLGTRIFLDSEITPKQKFLAIIHNTYDTDLEATDFSNTRQAADTINSWIDKQTNGRVSQIVRPGDLSDTIMLIANTIFFRGTWRHQFPKNKTHLGRFYLSPKQVISDVEYMTTTDKFFYHESTDLDSKILRLPYRGKRYALYIVLPKSKGGLPELIKKINLQILNKQLYNMESTAVEVRIPKFGFKFQSSFKKILQDMGLNQMFQNTSSFPGIARGGNAVLRKLVVSDIIQKTGIQVDEEGSVVYAATEVTIGNKFGDVENVFNATHPFLFFIEERTRGTILFVGKVENPLEMESVPIDSMDSEQPIQQASSGDTEPANVHQRPTSTSTLPSSTASSTVQQVQPLSNNSPNLQPTFFDPIEQNGVASRFNFFDLDLLEAFSNSDSSKNVFISPASIKITLAMILEGARGECAREIGTALRINDISIPDIRDQLSKLLFDLSTQSGSTILESSNGIFVSDKYRVVPEYKSKLVKDYGALIETLDFSNSRKASNHINMWADKSSHGIIKEIAGQLYADTTILIANVMYFKGKWKTEFDAKSTKLKCFNTLRNGCVDTPMMQVTETFDYNFVTSLNAHAVDVPYEGGEYSMLLLIPNNGDVRLLAKDIKHENIDRIIRSLKPVELTLEMPKFDIEFSTDLIEYLKPLSIREIFGDKANLTGIINKDNVKINNIVHKTKIEVNELGTKAAAATTAIVIPLMGSSSPKIQADRPYIFFIYHKGSNNIIFTGIYNHPERRFQEPVAPPAHPQRVRQGSPPRVVQPIYPENYHF